jgi:Protein of unknown function (DUF3142)
LNILSNSKGDTTTTLVKRNLILFGCLLLSAAVLASALLARRFGAAALGDSFPSADRMAGLPRIILWAWERPEDLSFTNPREVGVAFLAGTLYLRNEKVIARPRFQPLSVSPETSLIAVVRIESDRAAPPLLSPQQRERTASAIAEVARGRAVAAVQIDFDARQSERAFYRDLLVDLRRGLPASVSLSITALASWCIYDDWLATLPVDEAVPMLFRMGVDHNQVAQYLKAGGDFRPALCRHSLGISTDEPPPRLPSGRRVYVFNPRPWSPENVGRIVREVNQSQ